MNINWIVERCNEVLFGIKVENNPLASLTVKELDQNLSEAAKHGMLPVVMESLIGFKTDDLEKKKVILKWYGGSEQSKKNYWKRLELMEQLALNFKNAGLDVMFLKGATIAQWYPKPELRMFGDIDYYMYGESEKGIVVLKKMGIKTSDYFNHHTQANFEGVLLENHYDFLSRSLHSNLLMDDELKRLVVSEGRQYPFRFNNPKVSNAYGMSPTMNAIFLMRHLATHFFSETVPLRMLYDWALFLQKYSTKVDWKKTFEMYKESGMPEFPCMIQGLLVSKLGLNFSNCPMEPIYGDTTEKIWQSILEPPVSNPYRMYSIRYLLFETRTRLSNHWKHQIVFQKESYWKRFFGSVWGYSRLKLTGKFE